ncbi:outer membrane protein [Reichenbachiella faecimaris]|uniref:Outer membrane protein n=1 Tax=Reichenbachiella faecimaris TaxID=692418 RepID=A0A1W2G9T2_REIFA|nr:TolC family protein [Reichenbachiella faecimaris]SMD33232.1 outer membrane protein [Reichenbachiella faecimaris]
MKIGIVKRMFFLLVLTALGLPAIGQNQDSTNVQSSNGKKILTLDECLRIAMDNNIQLKQIRNNTRIAKANDFQAIMNYLPALSGFANYTWNNGTGFDNSSGRFFTGGRESSFSSLNADLTLFNGLSNHYNKKATAKTLESNIHQIKATEQTVNATVLGAYLNVILDEKRLEISEDRIELLQAQLEREKKRNEVGVGDLAQVYNFQSQLANENLNKVNLQNQSRRDRLTLLQALQLDVSEEYDIAPVSVEDEASVLESDKFTDVLTQSVLYSPSLKSAKANVEAASFNHRAAQGAYLPTLRILGSYSTQYSSLNKDNSSGTPVDLTIADQYSNLTNKSLELRMTVPIFNRYTIRTNAQVARLNRENAKLNLESAELSLTNNVQQVYLDLVAAQETYKAAEDNLVALNQSFEFAKTRYENGNTDFFTYLESLNNKNRAEIELVNAKYSIVFRKKILDVYRGLL